MTINDLCRTAYEASCASGWHENDPKPGDAGYIDRQVAKHMLIVTEVAEATEAIRDHKPDFYVIWEGNEVEPDGSINRLNSGNISLPDRKPIPKNLDYWEESLGIAKPEGEAVELADALIRIADLAGSRGWDMEAIIRAKLAYNATRGHRHGGKTI